MRVRTIITLAAMVAAISVNAFSPAFSYYVTRSGKTYHKLDCRIIAGKTVYEVSYSDIEKQKLKACKICKP